jgi:hypothetical protein
MVVSSRRRNAQLVRSRSPRILPTTSVAQVAITGGLTIAQAIAGTSF